MVIHGSDGSEVYGIFVYMNLELMNKIFAVRRSSSATDGLIFMKFYVCASGFRFIV